MTLSGLPLSSQTESWKIAKPGETWETRRQGGTRMAASPALFAYPGLNSRFLEGLAPRDLKTILGAARLRRFRANSILYHQEDPVHTFYLLLEGRARFFYLTPHGSKLMGPSIFPGDILGGAALVKSKSSYLASAEAVKDSAVLAWDRATIRAFAARYPLLLDNALNTLMGYLNWFLAAHIGLACHSARLRLAQALLNMARDGGGKVGDAAELEVTNEELASAANVTTFTASRLLSEWRRCGALKKSRGKVLLRSPILLFSSKA